MNEHKFDTYEVSVSKLKDLLNNFDVSKCPCSVGDNRNCKKCIFYISYINASGCIISEFLSLGYIEYIIRNPNIINLDDIHKFKTTNNNVEDK